MPWRRRWWCFWGLLQLAGLGVWWLSAARPATSPRQAIFQLVLTQTTAAVLGLLAWRWFGQPAKTEEQAIRQALRAAPPAETPTALTPAGAAWARLYQRLLLVYRRHQAEHERNLQILETVRDGLIVLGGDGQIMFYNTAAAQLLAAPPEKRPASPSLALLTGDHRLVALWQTCRDEKKPQQATLHLPRSARDAEIVALPLPESDLCVLTLHDVTVQQRVEAMRRDFIANISHELRTPLASLKVLLETLGEVMEDDPEAARRFVHQMESATDTLVQLVSELLELARIESGQVPLDLQPVPLQRLLLPPIERLRPQVARAGLRLEIALPTAEVWVWADETRLPRVVTNLVHNAIKFTPSGGRIRVHAEINADEVAVHISDTGIGIPRDALPRIFERFYKLEPSRQSSGTGLGLAIAKHLVQAHGGQIRVASVEGQGSTFTFTLRRAPIPSKEQP